ncbi:hypothetical protein S40285_05756 [Stachybotrys chlorohalonatus IBT 40285]|uniref:Uncharacterized protein n=1 Tax=Stachybotrys chlorohalonatus (strain IBT 40285) TaxID=1283841 RepID=A0A084QSL0_STAC4|nr:hypothetical protein S40285_05756 [Stachybotrys chlorohalonata IBT 40285]
MATPAGFPSLQPAMLIRCALTGFLPCGDIYTGSTLFGLPFGEGSLVSVGDFEPKLDFKMRNGQDWFRIDNDKKHARATISGMAVDAEGRALRCVAEGVFDLNEHTLPLITGDAAAKSIPFGHAVEIMRFECGHEEYKAIENMLFASSLRLVKEESGEILAEIAISRIISGTGQE